MTPDNKDTKKNKLNLTIESLEMELMDPDSKAKKAAASKSAADSTAKKSETISGTDANLPVQYRQQGGDQNRALKTYSSNLQKAEESDSEVRKKGRMGDRMVAQGLITESQLNVALQEKKISGKMLGEILVELGFITEDVLTRFLAESSGFELFDPKHTIVDGDALALLEKKVALKYNMLPISKSGNDVRVAMADPYDVVALDTLRRFLPKGAQIKPLVTTAKILGEAIDAAYGYASSINAILKELEEYKDEKDIATLSEHEAYSHPIVRLVNGLLFEAVKMGASDLHFEPEENFVRLRYRLDGEMFTAQILHKQHWSGISQRIKIMSQMNIADKMSAQDGRFGLDVAGRVADFRVSSLPTVHGENIVLRVLDKSASIMPLSKLGFSEHNTNLIKRSQEKPEGIIIVTGPTGSGKTTSLYSMLNEINTVDVNIQTLEDPVEYSLGMIRQTHVREGVLEFAEGIKALLRQDPDIIFIGEIRDGETANMALKAAMTGHQVYTTLHTNDSFGAIPRLIDLGMKPGMIAGSIISVFAQRLTRVLCHNCKTAYKPDEHECKILGVEPSAAPQIYKARQGGCDMCAGQGYKGRIAVAEILFFDDDLDLLLARGESKADLKALAVKKGFKSMKDDGILKVLEGITDLQALSKVVDIH
ncbi:MAG TPA: ATPase, T2SS/T4P/T4SS family, partial [Alphaproteobacteria bacterium]|nr:ATPase, T2SS/T4P/T4SS family [Alphaproteobacteria bacterium]